MSKLLTASSPTPTIDASVGAPCGVTGDGFTA